MRDGIERAAEVPAMRLDAALAPGLGIDLEHGGAGGAQVAHEARLLELAGLEEPQDAARNGARASPSGSRTRARARRTCRSARRRDARGSRRPGAAS